MKKAWMGWLSVVALAAAGYAQTNVAGANAKASFEKIQSLAGTWEGKNSGGNSVTATYVVVSGGSAVMETLSPQGEANMVTLYHLDGSRLMMTHYCAAGNQPRMRAAQASADGKQITFAFQDATNLASPDAGHMVGLALAWKDSANITHAWTWREKGKPDHTEQFQFTRKK